MFRNSRILLIDDSIVSQNAIKSAMSASRAQIQIAETIPAARRMILDQANFDLLVINLNLASETIFDFFIECQSLENQSDTPIFVISSKNDVMSRVSAFSSGADDYIVLPMEPLELRARIEMRLRKSQSVKGKTKRIVKGALTICPESMEVTVETKKGAERMSLTNKEFRILLLLAQNEGRIQSRNDIVRAIWGESVHVLDRTVDSHICGLRKKMGPHGDYVRSILGVGYQFVPNSIANTAQRNAMT